MILSQTGSWHSLLPNREKWIHPTQKGLVYSKLAIGCVGITRRVWWLVSFTMRCNYHVQLVHCTTSELPLHLLPYSISESLRFLKECRTTKLNEAQGVDMHVLSVAAVDPEKLNASCAIGTISVPWVFRNHKKQRVKDAATWNWNVLSSVLPLDVPQQGAFVGSLLEMMALWFRQNPMLLVESLRLRYRA